MYLSKIVADLYYTYIINDTTRKSIWIILDAYIYVCALRIRRI